MRRRRRPGSKQEPPPHLREYVPADWGWPTVTWLDGHARFDAARDAWSEQHPGFDWIAWIVANTPDAPWIWQTS